jgi:hypothetical protein
MFVRNQHGSVMKAFERTCVRPPAVEDVVMKIAFLDIGVVDVRDFEFSAV